jgi:hypothetical protein
MLEYESWKPLFRFSSVPFIANFFFDNWGMLDFMYAKVKSKMKEVLVSPVGKLPK